MLTDVFELSFADDADLPAPDAADHVLVRWLLHRLRRHPSWLEVLALRAGLWERARRHARWAWWRRVWSPKPPRQEDLVADFMRSPEGRILFGFLGSTAALLAQLALPDPWQGYDGEHPRTARPTRREALRERVALGCAVPLREQVAAVLAYADWKLSGMPVMAGGFIPEAVEFLAPDHAAAINVMTGEAVIGFCVRLRHRDGGEAGCRAALRGLDRTGKAARRVWPGIERRASRAPLGIWPPPEDDSPSSTRALSPPELLDFRR